MIDKLEDLIIKGLVKDVYYAEANLAIYKKISDNIDLIKTTPKEDQNLFGYLQSSAEIQLVLAVSRLYDTRSKSKRYTTRCIEELLEFILKEKSNFPAIKDHPITVSSIRAYRPKDEAINSLIEAVSNTDTSVFPNRFYGFYSSEYLAFEDTIENIRMPRHKFIAHNEAIEISTFEDIKHSDALKLLKFAQEIISVISAAYLSKLFSGNGVYLLSIEAQEKYTYFIDHLFQKVKQQNKSDNAG